MFSIFVCSVQVLYDVSVEALHLFLESAGREHYSSAGVETLHLFLESAGRKL